MNTKVIFVFVLVGTGMVAANDSKRPSCRRLPNIVLMLMDDMGWGDIGCYGNEARETPNIDKLAEEGALFTDFYSAAPTCSPSRAGMLTGRLPIRTGMYTSNSFGVNAVFRPDAVGSFPAEEETIAEVLAKLGYRNKLIGKWHLGNNEESFPLNNGFHEFFGLKEGRFGNVEGYPNSEVYDNDKMVGRTYEREFFMNITTGESDFTRFWSENAVEFIEENKDNPFFLFWSADGTHSPIVAHKDFLGTSERGLYGDVIRDIDYGVGQIMSKLKEHNLDRNTFVFFGSDNGHAAWDRELAGHAGPFLCGKTTTFEGGMRVPGIFWWPGVIPAGQIEKRPSSLMDIFPTILEITGTKASNPYKLIDGQSLLPLLIDQQEFTVKTKPVFYYRGNGLFAIRVGNYKAHYWSWNTSQKTLNSPVFGDPCPGEYQEGFITVQIKDHHDQPILFHLGRDPGEKFPIDPSTEEYECQIDIINQICDEHLKTLEGYIRLPQLNYIDKSLCEKLVKKIATFECKDPWSPLGIFCSNKNRPTGQRGKFTRESWMVSSWL